MYTSNIGEFMYNPFLQFMKLIRLRPYSDEEIMNKIQKGMRKFLSYYNLQHTHKGFLKACEHRDTMLSLYDMVKKQENPDTKRKCMDMLLAYVNLINSLGFR